MLSVPILCFAELLSLGVTFLVAAHLLWRRQASHRAALMYRVHATAPLLRLITFDADGTLYADGAHIEHDNRMIDEIIELLVRGVHVSIVTAAGYPGDSRAFEARTQGLLDAFASRQLVREVTDRFSLLGGECNYLLKCVAREGAWLCDLKSLCPTCCFVTASINVLQCLHWSKTARFCLCLNASGRL
jgi:IMP-specific 5'-nucleotidase